MKKIKQNIPNMITMSRIIASIIAGGLFVSGNILPSVLLYVYGAISDFFDGLAARKLNATTELGKKLDPISDKIFALSLLTPSIVLGNYLMILPLLLEGEIASIIIAAKNMNINMETERVGKYKTWFLFSSLILGLLSTKFPAIYFPLALSLGYTTHFQLQSIKTYKNQLQDKLNNKEIKNEIIDIKENDKNIENNEKSKTKELNKLIKEHYNELMYYNNIEVKDKTKRLVKKKNRYY